MSWSSLTHQIHLQWKNENLRGQKLLVLWSGGADSTALLSLANELAEPLSFRLTALHVHHGDDPKHTLAREVAQRFCLSQAEKWKIPLLIRKSDTSLKSEEEFRDFRYQEALLAQKENHFDRILVAHHQDDLLETRFFRLLRGTGPQGLASMTTWDNPFWRPLLKTQRPEILSYIKENHLEFHEDPSNSESHYRRNWIRHEVLPFLENQMPGSVQNLARGLERMVEFFEHEKDFSGEELWLSEGISRAWLLTLTVREQRRALAQYLWRLKIRDFNQNHLEEILKHLDNPEKEHKFNCARCEWLVNAERIIAVCDRQKRDVFPGGSVLK